MPCEQNIPDEGNSWHGLHEILIFHSTVRGRHYLLRPLSLSQIRSTMLPKDAWYRSFNSDAITARKSFWIVNVHLFRKKRSRETWLVHTPFTKFFRFLILLSVEAQSTDSWTHFEMNSRTCRLFGCEKGKCNHNNYLVDLIVDKGYWPLYTSLRRKVLSSAFWT